MADSTEKATLAGGCFWCTEAIFQRLKGVTSVMPGYSGGWVETPSYEEVCGGQTGHAEAIQITFDPKTISFETLLDVFFHLHDPTTKNQQGADVGPQYRSAIFYHSEVQKKTAEKKITELTKKGVYKSTLVTEVGAYKNFYPAEVNHRDYYNKNSYAPYCQAVIDPKIHKLVETYPKLTK